MRLLVMTLSTLGILGGQAFAEGSHDFNFHYHVFLQNDDQGHMKQDGMDAPTAQNSVNESLYFTHSGTMGDTEYTLYANVLTQAVEIAKATRKMGAMWLSAGVDFINQGGYEQDGYVWSTIEAGLSPYVGAGIMPFASSTAFEFGYNIGDAGGVSLQIFDDVKDDGSNTYINTTESKPAWAFEYMGGNFGGVKPLLQYVGYDRGQSTQLAVGLGFDFSGVTGSLDYVMDNRGQNTTNASGKEEVKQNKYTNIALSVGYDAGMAKPFLKYASTDRAEHTTDIGGNQDAESYDDNGTVIMVGSDFNVWDESMVPYFAYVSRTQDVLKDATTSLTEVDSKTRNLIYLGVRGTL